MEVAMSKTQWDEYGFESARGREIYLKLLGASNKADDGFTYPFEYCLNGINFEHNNEYKALCIDEQEIPTYIRKKIRICTF